VGAAARRDEDVRPRVGHVAPVVGFDAIPARIEGQEPIAAVRAGARGLRLTAAAGLDPHAREGLAGPRVDHATRDLGRRREEDGHGRGRRSRVHAAPLAASERARIGHDAPRPRGHVGEPEASVGAGLHPAGRRASLEAHEGARGRRFSVGALDDPGHGHRGPEHERTGEGAATDPGGAEGRVTVLVDGDAVARDGGTIEAERAVGPALGLLARRRQVRAASEPRPRIEPNGGGGDRRAAGVHDPAHEHLGRRHREVAHVVRLARVPGPGDEDGKDAAAGQPDLERVRGRGRDDEGERAVRARGRGGERCRGRCAARLPPRLLECRLRREGGDGDARHGGAARRHAALDLARREGRRGQAGDGAGGREYGSDSHEGHDGPGGRKVELKR
jgi:hypothetical protein